MCALPQSRVVRGNCLPMGSARFWCVRTLSAVLLTVLAFVNTSLTQVGVSGPENAPATSDQSSTMPVRSASCCCSSVSDSFANDDDENTLAICPQSGEKKTKSREAAFVGVPIPTSSSAIGSGIVPVGGYIFRLRKSDEVSPPSVVGIAGLVTNNGSRGIALGAQLYFKQDMYHLTAGLVHGNLNYNLYGTGIAAGNAGLKLPLKQTGQAFFGEFLRRIGWKFFLGPRFMTGNSVITIDGSGSGSSRIPVPADAGFRTTLRAIGLHLNRDTRPNRFYPTTGTVFDFTSDFFSQSLGSKYSFQSYRVMFNKYGSLSDKQVLAYNAMFCATGGQPPFYGNCLYGTNNELRGYAAGRYIDRYMMATQLEYRLVLPWRLGLVGFGGIGGVAPSGRELFRTNNFLPAGGGGLRFLLSKLYHVNLRADIAAGKNGHTFSMGLGEAF